jgi:hypothetical protein
LRKPSRRVESPEEDGSNRLLLEGIGGFVVDDVKVTIFNTLYSIAAIIELIELNAELALASSLRSLEL